MQAITLPAGRPDSARAAAFIQSLPVDRAWRVVVEAWKPRRSDQQNNFLWGVVYPTLINSGAEEFQGLVPTELHYVLLGACFGEKTVKSIGGTRTIPNRTSSKLSKAEFSGYVAWIQQTAGALGVYVPDPNEVT
jgi:hypothetical protein